MNQQELSTTLSIALLYVVRMLGLFMVLPVLPLMAPGIDGATPLLIGTALGIYGLSQAILQIPMGIWSDRIGRKPILIAALSVFVIGSLVAASAEDIYGIILGRFLQGCGAIASTLLALLADVTRPQHRGKAMAIVGMSIGASFGVSLILGPWLNGWLGLSALFYLTALLGCVGMGVMLLLVKEPATQQVDPYSHLYPAKIGQVLKTRGIPQTTLGVFLLHFLLMSSFVVFPVLMLEVGGIPADDHHWYYFSLLAATFVLMGPLMWLSDRKGRAKPMLVGMIGLFVVGNLILAGGTSLAYLLVGLVFFFMAFNLLEVILPAMVSKLAPAGCRGTAMGIYSTAQFGGAFVGGVAGGYLSGAWDIAYVLYANAALCLVWIVLAIGLPAPGNISSLTVCLRSRRHMSNKEILEAVLSVRGVIDAVIIDAEQVAYLKIDEECVDRKTLAEMGHLPV